MITLVYRNQKGYTRDTPKSNYPVITTPPHGTHLPPSVPISTATIRAAKVGISTEEWQRRDSIVRNLALQAKDVWKFMDDVYPYSISEYLKYGKCAYLGCVYSYMEIDHSEWPADDDVFVFSIKPLNPRTAQESGLFVCNYAFMQKEAPTK